MTLSDIIGPDKPFITRYRLAKALGLHHQQVYRWTEIPETRQWQIELILSGKLARRDQKEKAA